MGILRKMLGLTEHAVEEANALAHQAKRVEPTLKPDDVADYLQKVKETGQTHRAGDAAKTATTVAPQTVIAQAPLQGMAAVTTPIYQGVAGALSKLSKNTKLTLSALGIAYIGFVDTPFTEGKDPIIPETYKSLRGIKEGVPVAENDAKIATVRAQKAETERGEQLTKLNQNATGALAGMGRIFANPEAHKAPALAAQFEQAIKQNTSGIEESKLQAFSANFASIGVQLGVSQDGKLGSKDQLKLANSQEFSDLIDNLPLATKEKTNVLKALLPAPAAAP